MGTNGADDIKLRREGRTYHFSDMLVKNGFITLRMNTHSSIVLLLLLLCDAVMQTTARSCLWEGSDQEHDEASPVRENEPHWDSKHLFGNTRF